MFSPLRDGQRVRLRCARYKSPRGRAGVPGGGIPVTRHCRDTQRRILENNPRGVSATTFLFCPRSPKNDAGLHCTNSFYGELSCVSENNLSESLPLLAGSLFSESLGDLFSRLVLLTGLKRMPGVHLENARNVIPACFDSAVALKRPFKLGD